MFRSVFRIIGISFALGMILSWTVSLHAQTSLGQIAGNVTDQTGGAIPDATITITDVDTQAVRSVKADDSGFYVATNLAIGTYSVSVAPPGFRGETRSGLIISADAHLTADFHLQIGSTSEAITVSAVAGETLNTTSGELSHVIDTKQVQNLALNGRNYTQQSGYFLRHHQSCIQQSVHQRQSCRLGEPDGRRSFQLESRKQR
jgi:hypothetical protein